MTAESNAAPTSFKTLRTPCGLDVAYINEAETQYVYQEMFKDQIYFRHGIHLSEGDTVFDVGANIGLFSMFVQEKFPNIRLFCFEPAAEVFSALQINMSRYGDRVTAYQCGISNETKLAKFTFYPHYSIISGFHASEAVNIEVVRQGILNQWHERFPERGDLEERFLESLIEETLGEKQEVLCPLRTLSEIVKETQVEEISLLKIDAEGSELDVLAGIDADDWRKIRQVVMEIHDSDGTVRTKINAKLESEGFKIFFEEESQLNETGIVNCYATRQ